MEKNPFPDLKITSSDFLDKLEGRQKCCRCQKSRKFYCYSCYLPLPGTEDKIPRITLPVKIDIIKHRQEVDGKSTSGHAALVAPDDVTVYTYPNIPHYPDQSKVVVVFPGPTSVTLEEYVKRYSQPIASTCHGDNMDDGQTDSDGSGSCDHHKHDMRDESTCDQCGTTQCCASGDKKYARTFDRVVFIDSTWHQVAPIRDDPRLQDFQKVELKTYTTQFWRHQRNKSDTYLATIEAIYYFLREFHELYEYSEYTGQYDDLLFFFAYMYRKIRFEFERGKPLKAYQHRETSPALSTEHS